MMISHQVCKCVFEQHFTDCSVDCKITQSVKLVNNLNKLCFIIRLHLSCYMVSPGRLILDKTCPLETTSQNDNV